MSEALDRAARYIAEADAVLVAAGAGMSFDSGLDDITEKGFKAKFPAMYAKGYPTMLEAIGVDFENDTLQAWGYYATRMKWYRDTQPHQGYALLLDLCRAKGEGNTFVFTSNVDGLFQKSGFDPRSIYEKQGSYKYLQCIRGPECNEDVWEAQPALAELEKAVDPDTLIAKDASLVPRCPRCRAVAYHNANANQWWVNKLYRQQNEVFSKWLKRMSAEKKKVVVVELGCGKRLPFIRHPVEGIVEGLQPRAKLVRINPAEPDVPFHLSSRDCAVGLPYSGLEGMRLLHRAVSSSNNAKTTLA